MWERILRLIAVLAGGGWWLGFWFWLRYGPGAQKRSAKKDALIIVLAWLPVIAFVFYVAWKGIPFKLVR